MLSIGFLLLLGTRLVDTNCEGLASLKSVLVDALAFVALELQHNLFRGFGLKVLRYFFSINIVDYLLVEDGLGLTSVTLLLTVITSLTLSPQARLADFVLCNLVLLVVLALDIGAVGGDSLWEVNLKFTFVSQVQKYYLFELTIVTRETS